MRDRVVDFRRVPANTLVRNQKNWRKHPEAQRDAIRAVIREVGFVGALIAREVDGVLELIDGELRTDIAADALVPVIVVDLDDKEAAKVLATYDPISAMAVTDDKALRALVKEVDLDSDAELRRLLTDIERTLAGEEEEGVNPEDDKEIPGMALEPHEHYDYLVVLAVTTHEWNVLCARLGLEPAKRHKRMGTCRAVRASKVLPLLKDETACAS